MLGGPIRGLKIGVDETWIFKNTHPDVAAVLRAALEVFVSLGAVVTPMTFPDASDMVTAWTDLCAVETTLAHDLTYPSRAAEYGPEIAGFLDRGLSVSAKDLGRAQIYRDVFKGEVAALFDSIDVLICPVIPGQVPTVPVWDEVAASKGDFGEYIKYTAPFNFTGNPAAIMQGGFDGNGVPVGFQLIGPHFSEGLLFKAGHAFQTVTDWHTKHPAI